jgi:hypothetical protein
MFYRRLLRKFSKNLITLEFDKKKFALLGKPITGYYESIDHQKARKLISFITVIHAVEALNVDRALEKALELKKAIIKYVSKMPGASCLGVVEIEITSIKQFRRIRDFNHAKDRNENSSTDEDGVITFEQKAKRYLKLEDCEALSSHLSSEEINGESGQFIIHFHGILNVQKPEDIKKLNGIFLNDPNWNRGKNQVSFQRFSTTWKQKHKTIEESLKDMAYYFTKGGAVAGKSSCYLQYKLDFPKAMKMVYEDYLTLSERNCDEKRQKMIEKGNIFDLPILSHHEINSLTLVVNGMMTWNKLGTGYVVSVGKW